MKADKTDNELIAEFMGFVDGGNYWAAIDNPYKNFEGGHRFYSSELLFDESWDWIMPVVELLNEPVVKNGKIIRSAVQIDIFYKACNLKFEPDEDFEDIDDFSLHTQGKTKIEAVYKAVVEFIKWYNSLNHTKP